MEKEILVVEYIYFILRNAVEDRSCLDFSLDDLAPLVDPIFKRLLPSHHSQ